MAAAVENRDAPSFEPKTFMIVTPYFSCQRRTIHGGSGAIDFRRFDDRSLSAVALNKDDQFSTHEVAQAKAEIRQRDSDAIKASYQSTSDADGGFGKAMITRYAGMTTEEREASGWTPALYNKMVELQASRDKLAQMFNADGTVAAPASLLDYL